MGNITPQQIQDHIKQTPIAGYITDADLKKFCGWLKVVKYDAKQSVYNAGDKSKEFYIILSGEVEIRTPYPALEVITTKRKGEYFGFSGVVNGQHTLTAVVGATECLCLVLPERKKDKMLAGVKITTDPTKRGIILGILGWEPHIFLKFNKFLRELTDVQKWGQLGCMWNCIALQEGQRLFEEGSEGNALYLVVKGGCKAVTSNAELATGSTPTHATAAAAADAKSSPGAAAKPAGAAGAAAAAAAASGAPAASTSGSADGKKELVLGEFKENDVFGEISVFLNVPRTASIVCTKPNTLLLEIRRAEFTSFLKILPNVDTFETLMRQRTAEQFKKLQKSVPFYGAIPAHMFPELAKICKIEEVGPNRTVFKEGDVGQKFYIIIHGSAKVTVKGVDGDGKDKRDKTDRTETLLANLTPGRYFGEIALMRDCPRTATVTTTARTVLLSITKESFVAFFAQAPEALSDFEMKLARYDVQLRSILYHPAGLKYFSEFCKSEFSEENLDFWRACRDFRRLSTQLEHDKSVSPAEAKAMLAARANTIASTYVTEDAKKQVNIISAIRNRLLASLKQGLVASTLFAEAEAQILSLLSSDSFNRFKLSDNFTEMLKKLDSYTLGKESQIKRVEEAAKGVGGARVHMRSSSNAPQIGKDFKLDAATLAQLRADSADDDEDDQQLAPPKKSDLARDAKQTKAGSLRKPGAVTTVTTPGSALADDDPNDFSMSKPKAAATTTAGAGAGASSGGAPPLQKAPSSGASGAASASGSSSSSGAPGLQKKPSLNTVASNASKSAAAAAVDDDDDPNDFSCSKPSKTAVVPGTAGK